MGKALAVLIWLLVIGTVVLFLARTWFPENISEHGSSLDAQFNRTLVVVGIAFVAAQIALGYAVLRYGRRGSERAQYSHGSGKLEVTWTVITAAVFIGLAVLGQRVWAQLHLNAAPSGSAQISVVSQQFQFNFHYPGVDKTFGRTAARYISDSSLNYVGLDPTDPAGNDDVQVTTLVVPANRPSELILRSKDVIHSLFIPVLRVKQDLVPGMSIRIHFTALKPGRYEVTCAELCGSLHSTMKSFMLVLPDDEYNEITAMSEEDFKERMVELLQAYGKPAAG